MTSRSHEEVSPVGDSGTIPALNPAVRGTTDQRGVTFSEVKGITYSYSSSL
jgi:hypothetical protein